MAFNGNTAPRVRKTERPDKAWQCNSCGETNQPWWKTCTVCNKRKD